ncbi:hypothetical protein FJZ27_03450, partial [Candidatus Peribacteria bacterium]|nr:hypothetical protein [Candidatus Peribacteria bacterium]
MSIIDRDALEREIAELTEATLDPSRIQDALQNLTNENAVLDRVVSISHKYRNACADKTKGMFGAAVEDAAAKQLEMPTIDDLLTVAQEIEKIRSEVIRRLHISTEELQAMQEGDQGPVKGRPNITVREDIHTPPDAWQPPEGDGDGRIRMSEFSERLTALRYLLWSLGIDPNDDKRVVMEIGRIRENMMRRVSYVSVLVPEVQRLIELCNQVGNRSFVWKTADSADIEMFAAMGKDEKKARLEEAPGIGWQIVMGERWMDRMRECLTADAPIANTPAILREVRERKGWHERYAELVAWRRDHPDGWPSEKSKDEQEKSLGVWLREQRGKLRNGELDGGQAEQLRALGVEPAEKQKSWHERYAELVAWRGDHADGWPSEMSKDAQEKSLGMWLSGQRGKLRDGKLEGEQAEQLRALGVEPAEKQKSWDERYAELVAWRRDHPDGWPSAVSKDAQEKSLGKWLSWQRGKLRNGELDGGQAEQLRALGVEPAEKKEGVKQSWDEHYAELVAWQKDHPDRWPSEMSKDEQGKSLGKWLSRQRGKLRDGELDGEQAEQLRALGVKPVEKQKSWDERYAELVAWQKDHADGWPSAVSKDAQEKSLGMWLSGQRGKLRNGELDGGQAEQLRALGVKPVEKQKSWDERYAELVAWRRDHPDGWPSAVSKDAQEKSLG